MPTARIPSKVVSGDYLSRKRRVLPVDAETRQRRRARAFPIEIERPRFSNAYAHRALSRSLSSTLRTQPIRLLTPEDFVVFKVLSTRELDLDDARSVLLSLGAEIDRGLIESEIATLEGEEPGHPISERWRRVATGAG
jgi:hypothetical protein